MDFYVKQRVFSWRDRFSIYDMSGCERYYVEGESFSFGKKLHVYDLSGFEVAYIHQKVFSFAPRYYIYRHGNQAAEIVKKFTFFRDAYFVNGPGWTVNGDFFDHSYEITNGGLFVAAVQKEWFSFGDAYRISVNDCVDEVMALATCLVIDACIDAEHR